MEQALGAVGEVNGAVGSLAAMEVGLKPSLRYKSNDNIHPLVLFVMLYSVLTT